MNIAKSLTFILMLFGLFLQGLEAKAQSPSLYLREFGQKLQSLDTPTKEKPLSVSEGVERLERLAVLFNEFKAFSSIYQDRLIDQIEGGHVLRGQQLTTLHRSVKYFLNLSQHALALSMQFAPASLKNLEYAFATQGASENAKALLWLSLQLEVLEGFLTSYRKAYLENGKLRRLINAEDASYKIGKGEVKALVKALVSRKYAKNMKRALSAFEKNVTLLERQALESEELRAVLHRIGLLKISRNVVLGEKLKNLRKKARKGHFKDFFARAASRTVHHLSGFFGNTAGAVKFRRGFLDKDERILKELNAILRPLDVITEKTPFILTDKFIPGHFGHNAIWLGTEEQLKARGLWDHPAIVPLQEDIRTGKSIIETDRSGTHLKDLETFMNVDEVAVLRINEETLADQGADRIYTTAISQLGKTYDFNFDVETTDRLVCSELLYQSFGAVAWPTEPYLGRTTISPDNVSELSLWENTPLRLVYHLSAYDTQAYWRKDLLDLAKDMGYRLNEELSDDENPYFEKPATVCRKMVVRGLFRDKVKKVCSRVFKHFIYEAPSFMTVPSMLKGDLQVSL